MEMWKRSATWRRVVATLSVFWLYFFCTNPVLTYSSKCTIFSAKIGIDRYLKWYISMGVSVPVTNRYDKYQPVRYGIDNIAHHD
jgi:hypothetical protein